jgi:D-alanyl-D-alanine carboxypeptidase/D-alanyl-D-alanine-endopeptidase (penicillin-binding protein 4)
MKLVFSLLFIVFGFVSRSQNITEKIGKAWQKFEADSQLRSAISSLYVINAKTGEVVFDRNGKKGLATASTLKVITAASAYEMLGNRFEYKTQFSIVNHLGEKTWLAIRPSGDPTFGSWRWKENNRYNVLKRIVTAVKKHPAKIVGIFYDETSDDETIPGGWVWEDIGNYYGAGAQSLNWNENQFDVYLQSGDSIGADVSITGTNPVLYNYSLESKVKSAAKGTGDNAYIYFPVGRKSGVIRGTIPLKEKRFVISGSMLNSADEFIEKLGDTLKSLGLYNPDNHMTVEEGKNERFTILGIHTEYSPHLDSMVFWFLRKSINLYGEAFVKTIARTKTAKPTTDSGIDTIVGFWKQRGIDPVELKMVDGSGLSPLNRVTTHAQVQVLQYAKKQSWFKGFYDAFPEYNGMKIKSGTINGVKGYCGYHKAKDGSEYIFSFLVNNYNGSASGLVNKMYKVLDELK